MSDDQQDPKLIVDEDWKSQVQAEKEAAAKPQQEQPDTTDDDTAQPAPSRGPEPRHEMGPIPPAGLDVLLSTLAAQAMTAMGHLPDPIQGHPVVRPDLAKHYIDMVGMLQEKTKGNLTPDEAKMIENLLHELRMIFVSTRPPEASK